MTVLSALAGLYDRMAEEGTAPLGGYSTEKIGGEIVIDHDGFLVEIVPRLVAQGKKMVPVHMDVPAAIKRSSGIASNFLWDKSAYVLGVTAQTDDRKKVVLVESRPVPIQDKRTPNEHAEFIASHIQRLEQVEDDGALALLRFLERWSWEDFAKGGWSGDLLDRNLVFRLRGDAGYLHDRPALAALLVHGAAQDGPLCLVSGSHAPVARLHPLIKGVMGAQSSGASLVSFNDPAYESFGKKRGDIAPVSERAAFAYGTALNALLARSGKGTKRRSLRIGDATTVFWAETPSRVGDEAAEDLIATMFDPPSGVEDDEALEDAEENLRLQLEALAQGHTPEDSRFHADTRVYVLGLSPNAARLSVRFWLPGTLGQFAANVLQYRADLCLAPPAWKRPPAVWALLYETALQRKAENIPPLLGGSLMRAVLNGTPYPRQLLSAVIGRIRADGIINGPRAAICKAVINRNTKGELPVSLDRENTSPAYRLGRLFAMLETIQQEALGKRVNATIRDRYFASASATPARVFPVLMKTATHHLASVRKGDKGGLAHWFDEQLGEIWSGLEATMPASLNLEDQGRFVAGYYHQKYAKHATPTADDKALVEDDA